MQFDRDSKMSPLQLALWAFLLERHAGPENAQPRAVAGAVGERMNLADLECEMKGSADFIAL